MLSVMPSTGKYCKSCSDFPDYVLSLPATAETCFSCGGSDLGDMEEVRAGLKKLNEAIIANHKQFVTDVESMNARRGFARG